MSLEGSNQKSKEYTVQCVSELTAGATLLKAGRSVSVEICITSSTSFIHSFTGQEPFSSFLFDL